LKAKVLRQIIKIKGQPQKLRLFCVNPFNFQQLFSPAVHKYKRIEYFRDI
jgi:hypothetical protein